MNESNLSKNPPWPGIKLLESFKEADLFNNETIVSPIKDNVIIIMIE